MTVEIDDNVPVPQKQAWTTAHQPDSVGKAQEPRQIYLEEAIAASTVEDIQDGIDYGALAVKAKVAAVWLNRKTFLVWFVPTRKGAEIFEWQTHLVVPQLLTEFDATRLRHKCGFKDVGAGYNEYASIELQLVTEQELMSGGFNYEFNANNYEPSQGGGAHPAGNFEAYVSATSVEPNKAGNGGNFVVEFTTESGSIKKYYSLWHENPKTVESAHKQLSALSHATGVYRINMNDGGRALVNGRCRIEVGKQSESEYMEIKKVFDMQGNLPGKGSNNQGGNNGPQGGGFGGNNQQQGNQQNNQNNQQQGGFNPNQQNNQQGFNPNQQQNNGNNGQQNNGNFNQQGGGNPQQQGNFGNQQGPGPGFAGGGQQDTGGGQQQGWGNQGQGQGQGGNQGGGGGWGGQQGWQQNQQQGGGNDKPGWAS